TYEHILSAYSRKDDSSKIWMLQKRMDAEGLQPTRSFYQKALKFAGRTGNVSLQARILHMMGIYGYTITNRTYYYLILGACRNWELERALDLLVEMDKKQIRPNLDSYLEIIDLAIKFRQASVAFELLQKVEKLESFKGPHQDTYLKVLNCAAVEGHYNIAKTIWEEAVKRYNLKADEGTCLYIMNLAGQNNDPYLTNDVLRNISDQGHRFRECHFIPLIEAYASTKDISGISTIFKSMRGVGVIPNKSMATMLIRKFGRDRTAARKARNNLMKAAKRSEYIDVVVFNFVIHALAYFAANEEAISMYNRREEYGVTQNSETVDAVLDACIHSHDAELGETIYQRALSEGIKPSSTTLSKMVALMTILDKYEEAFKYLELMKSQNMIPLRGCYYTLIKRLSYNNDERAHTVVDDMRACGYE
ncbi:hypothetical protein BDF20DRAFT_798384, partial [Mycotypha africana]|uniref:uncharacterized protein n=1 Tax=Mycotypha africana TaxID=64632 RepID=UPI002300AF6F